MQIFTHFTVAALDYLVQDYDVMLLNLQSFNQMLFSLYLNKNEQLVQIFKRSDRRGIR